MFKARTKFVFLGFWSCALCIAIMDNPNMLRFYYLSEISRRYRLSRELTVFLLSWMFWPRPEVDTSVMLDFLATYVIVENQRRPLWDDMNWVRVSRMHLHGRHASMRLAVRDCFAVAVRSLHDGGAV